MTFSILVLIIIMAALSIIVIVANWIIYEKASKPGWASIVPIYSTIVLLEIVGKPIWWIALMLIPVANIVIAIWVTNLLAKSY